jgi:hypothetical protein
MSLGRIPLLGIILALGAPACGSDGPEPLPVSNGEGPAPFDPDQVYEPDVTAAGLAVEIANPLFPAPVSARWVYQADTDEGLERIDVSVEAETHDVWGTTARVVRDTVFLEGEMIEDTRDWYAQDAAGNVWYLGEDTYEYEFGEVVCSCGAWTSGVDGALPGVVMLAQPKVGDVYRQEYLVGEAEDVAEVVATGASVTVPAGSFGGCLETRDRSAIDPELDEYKYYCPGVGLVLVEEGDVRVELTEYSGLE